MHVYALILPSDSAAARTLVGTTPIAQLQAIPNCPKRYFRSQYSVLTPIHGGSIAVVHHQQISLTTNGNGDMHDLTGEIASVVDFSGIRAGLVNIFNIGSTAAIGTIEFEPGLEKDLPSVLNKLLPPSRNYGHEQTWHDGNGHSHLQATLLGPSLTVPIAGGKLILGTWQQIFHLECDVRGRQRTIAVTVMGE